MGNILWKYMAWNTCDLVHAVEVKSPRSHMMKAPRISSTTDRTGGYSYPLGIFIFPRKRIVANEARRHNSLRWHCQCVNNAQAIRNLCKLGKLSPSIVAQQSDLDSQQLATEPQFQSTHQVPPRQKDIAPVEHTRFQPAGRWQ